MSELRFRERSSNLPFMQVVGRNFYRNKRNGYTMPGPDVSVYFAPGVTEKCFDTIREGPPYQSGGPLFLVRITEPTGVCAEGLDFPNRVTLEPVGYPIKRESSDLWQQGYEGKYVHVNLPSLLEIPGKSIAKPDDYNSFLNANDLQNLGNAAYSKLRPKVERAGLGQAIAEARDVPATLRQTSQFFAKSWADLAKAAKWKAGKLPTFMSPKKLADQFVGIQFGWKPFVNDVSQMLDLTDHYFTYVEQAESMNDKWVQRTFHEEEITSEQLVYNQTRDRSSPLFATYLNPSVQGTCESVTLQVRRQKMTRIWYAGSFKYYRPEFDRSLTMNENVRAGRQFLTLAGANINPVLLYKVTPWTWLIDMFANVGGNIQAAQDIATNAVASRYMYLMREVFDRYEYTSTHRLPNTVITGISYQEVRVKRRVEAESPFGFTLPVGGLSDMQLAILGALGIARKSPV